MRHFSTGVILHRAITLNTALANGCMHVGTDTLQSMHGIRCTDSCMQAV